MNYASSVLIQFLSPLYPPIHWVTSQALWITTCKRKYFYEANKLCFAYENRISGKGKEWLCLIFTTTIGQTVQIQNWCSCKRITPELKQNKDYYFLFYLLSTTVMYTAYQTLKNTLVSTLIKKTIRQWCCAVVVLEVVRYHPAPERK